MRISRRALGLVTFATLVPILSTAARAADADAAAADAGTIVVTGTRAKETARAEEKLSPNLLNIQSAEEILKYPDFNAAESLGRIPGVSLAIDTGEGRFVNIRGIDGNLNGTTFGGVVLLNTQPGGTYFGGGGRAVELDTIPIGAVDRLVVRKTGLPDQEAEGLGGSVELSPRSAGNVKRPFLDFTIGGGYQPAHDNGQIIRLEAAAGTRFGGTDKPFGVVVYGSYHEDHRGFDDLEAGYFNAQGDGVPDKVFDGVDFRRYSYNRRRFGFGGEISYDPDPQSHYFVRATNAGYTESVKRQILQLNDLGDPVTADPANASGFIATDASSRISSRDEQETHLNFVTAAGGRNDLGGVIIDYQGSYTAATYHRDYDYNSRFQYQGGLTVGYDNITNPDFPSFNVGSFNPDTTNLYRLTRLTNATERAHDREWAGLINVTIPVALLGADDAIKFGAKLRLRDKIDVPANAGYAVAGQTLDTLQGDGPYNDFYGRYAIGYRPNLPAIRALTNGGATNPNPGGFFNDTENVYAGFVQYSGKIGKLGILAGVRVEHTQGTYRGNVITTPLEGDDVITPTARKKNYTNVFPTIQLRYDFTPDIVARATWSTGIGRPGFLQLNSAATVDQGALAVSVGNPDLKPTTVNAFDVAVEYYLPESGVLSVGLFDKEFNNYVLARVQRGVDYLGDGSRYTVNSYSNVGHSYARGIEAQYTQKFARLPAPFDGLGFTGNVTYVDSRIQIRDQPIDYSLLPGTSKLTWNLGGFYEAHGVQVRIAAQHVSAAIFGVAGTAGFDVFQDARTTVDLTSSYDVTPQMQIYFNAKNLANTPLRYYEGFRNRPIQREYYDISYEAGFRFRF